MLIIRSSLSPPPHKVYLVYLKKKVFPSTYSSMWLVSSSSVGRPFSSASPIRLSPGTHLSHPTPLSHLAPPLVQTSASIGKLNLTVIQSQSNKKRRPLQLATPKRLAWTPQDLQHPMIARKLWTFPTRMK